MYRLIYGEVSVQRFLILELFVRRKGQKSDKAILASIIASWK
jgi:hypothetical protein